MSRLVKLEFARYEHDRVEEFKHMFATYLDEMIIAQKEVSLVRRVPGLSTNSV